MNWGYKRSFARCVLLFGAGTVLQFLCGDVNPTWLKHPVSVVLAINYVYLLIVLVAKSDKWQWVKSLTNHQTSVSSLASMLAVTILFGLTGKCGPSTWPFCTLLFYFITVLGLRAIEEIIDWRRSPKMAMIIHATVFVVLTSAFFSSPDKEKVRVMANIDKPLHTGISSLTGKTVILPFTLTLEDFIMENYPDGSPKTFLSQVKITDKKGERNFDIEVNHPAKVGAWRIYQVGYDKAMGTDSRYSVFECVRDGWYPVIKTGLWIILASGILMALTAGYKRKKEEMI